MAAEMRQDGK